MTQMVNVLHGKVVVVWMKRGGGAKVSVVSDTE